MELLCGFLFAAILVTVVGHMLWEAAAAVFRAVFGGSDPPGDHRPYRYCPGCAAGFEPRDRFCPRCDLDLDGRTAHALHRMRVAEREVRALRDDARLDADTAEQVIRQLDARARSLRGLPATALPRARPITEPPPPHVAHTAAPEPPVVAPEPAAPPAEPLPPVLAALEAAPPVPPAPPPPARRGPGFLEAHNILWGELVGGLLIVGCSIALVVTLRQALEGFRYFRFLLSAAVTLGLFGAGQYTLHRWKLRGTSRGMLVISLLLTPLTLLLLAPPFTDGAPGAADVAVKVLALAAFAWVVRTAARDLLEAEHLTSPADRRWLLAVAVVGAAGSQFLPLNPALAWLPLACFALPALAATGGLTWYRSRRRTEPVPDASGAALLTFVGLAAFALVAAWGLYVARGAPDAGARLADLAVPLALAAVPVFEAGVLVSRRVASAGLRTSGTAVALGGFGAVTGGLALAWPDPLALLLIAGSVGAYLTRVAFREKLPWVQVGAIGLLAFAAALGFHGFAGAWAEPEGLAAALGSSETGAVLAGFALALGLVAELLARRASHQTSSYAIGALAVGAIGLALASWHGREAPQTAALTHAALALGLVLANVRWERRPLAVAAAWLGVVGTLWALWWREPGRLDVWGFVLAAEALALAAGAIWLGGVRWRATALLRRAGRDVAFAASVLAVGLAVGSLAPGSDWHAATLFALALSGAALARLTGWAWLTWAGSSAALLGLLHVTAFAREWESARFAVEVALLAHATLAALAAVALRRREREFAGPFRRSARLSTALAVPLLFAPAPGYALATAGLAGWLGGVWLAFALRWRERGAFGAFQAAVTLAALLCGFAWVEGQSWWHDADVLFDPRIVHAFAFALGALGVGWALVRHSLRASPRARALWCDDRLSLDRVVLGAAVVGFLLFAAAAGLHGAGAELEPRETSFGRVRWAARAGIPATAFAPSAFAALLALGTAVVVSWRLSKVERDLAPHALGLSLVGLTGAALCAGTFAPELAVASALRWSLAACFVGGSAVVALRVPARRAAEALGFDGRPPGWLTPALLGVFGTAAAVVVLLSGVVADVGLNRLTTAGPLPGSAFARMGPLPSNLVPLALVVFGLALTAARERSSGYALTGGLVFVGTLTAGYALAVVTAGQALDGPEPTRLVLILAGAAAAWALLWQWVEWRIPGGQPLAIQVGIGFAALALVCLAPGAGAFVVPGSVLPERFEPLGSFGWFVLVLVCGAGAWHARRTHPEAVSVVPAFAGLIAGVLAATAAGRWDEPGRWLSFHLMCLTWAGVAAGFLAALDRTRLARVWLTCFAVLLVLCALRGGWDDPWRPWLPGGLALVAAVAFGAVAVRTRAIGFAAASVLTVTLAAVFVWVAWGPDSVFGLALAAAAGFGLGLAAWTALRVRLREAAWLEPLEIVAPAALAGLLVGLASTFAGARIEPPVLTWGALAAVGLACAAGLRAPSARFARPGLFVVGALAVALAVCAFDARPVWDVPATASVLSADALGCAVLVPRRRGEQWLVRAVPALAAVAGVIGLRVGLTAPDRLARLANPAALALLALAFAALSGRSAGATREALRTTSVALGVGVLAALAWALPDPADAHVWLHRNAWLVVALTVAAVGGSEGAPRFGTEWLTARRRVAGWSAVGAVAVLCVNLTQQVPVFDPGERRTPLTRQAAVAMLGAVAGLVFLALRFALKSERDPFALRPTRKTAYVYLAEVLVVLFFLQIRFNVPEVFRGDVAKLWTFAVMLLAYAGIGLAELFERKRLDVLAIPLRRTGVLLPLVPLLAFWLKPPAFVSELARGAAPGLSPLLDNLEKLPQHFGTYAWLWFLAGGVYGLVALSRRSFGWALLAALATNAALWSLLAHTEVPFVVHPQAWVIPLALIVLASEHINRRRLSAEASNAMRYAGVSMIYVASAADMFIAGVGASVWLPVVLAVLCVLGVLAGIRLRVRTFIHLGVAFLLLDVFAMIWHAAVDLEQTWVWYASGIVLGVAVLALFAYLEKRRAGGGAELAEEEKRAGG